ncbi:MAG: hypothetical protein PHG19_01065 [Anaerotignum sp.]|nr:hypothetical protein [Anaerotignum sp.]
MIVWLPKTVQSLPFTQRAGSFHLFLRILSDYLGYKDTGFRYVLWRKGYSYDHSHLLSLAEVEIKTAQSIHITFC